MTIWISFEYIICSFKISAPSNQWQLKNKRQSCSATHWGSCIIFALHYIMHFALQRVICWCKLLYHLVVRCLISYCAICKWRLLSCQTDQLRDVKKIYWPLGSWKYFVRCPGFCSEGKGRPITCESELLETILLSCQVFLFLHSLFFLQSSGSSSTQLGQLGKYSVVPAQVF